jgi:hypothetical protein
MDDVRGMLANAEAIGFKIHNQGLEEARIHAEIAELHARLDEARGVTAEFESELNKVYDQCVASGLDRAKVVAVVEGTISLLVAAGATPPEATPKGAVRKPRRGGSKRTDEAAADAETTVTAPSVIETVEQVPEAVVPSIVPEAPKTETVSLPVVEVAAVVTTPEPQIVAPVEPIAAPTVVESPVAVQPVEMQEVEQPAVVEEGHDDQDETFGVDVDLYAEETDSEMPEHDPLDEDDFNEETLANAAPIPEPAPAAPAAQPEAAAQPTQGFRRPSFLNKK